MTPDQLKTVLDAHALWLADHTTGKRANLIDANLTDADLYGADLSGVNLTGADLTGAIIVPGWRLVRV